MYNILVVDDEKEIVNAIEIYLNKEGYNIIKAYNGNQALKEIEKQEVHLVILDIMMPDLDGIQTAKKIREKYTMPIIMLSAKSEDYDKVLGLNTGADEYKTKPLNPIQLIPRPNTATFFPFILLLNSSNLVFILPQSPFSYII